MLMYNYMCGGNLGVHSGDVDCLYLYICTVTEYINGVCPLTCVLVISVIYMYVL